MAFNIVLFEPEIPNNTGNIGRLSLASGCKLHLVKPFGFDISDKRVKRAGLDYWKHVDLYVYECIEDFFEQHQNKPMAFFSAKAEKLHWELPYEKDLFLIFGKESTGLPPKVIKQYTADLYKIPLFSPHIRSLNLSNAVGIIVYQGLYQIK
ncbi:MAG: tRNA (cytidine(34)-2'-O)-methyltransferase [Saprospiraceae bacterium]|nr:tRNA (cytidine(34)-2'-O)-methyltransferase [Saprospiraceae bacterium]